jgi:capsular exopolysaccharide synthesis family protein
MGDPAGVLDAGVKKILMDNFGALSGVQGGLVSAAENREVRSILVTSSNRGEGKTITAIGMAYALISHASAQVLLIDGNFSAPMLHQHFGVPQQPGFTDFLSSGAGLEDFVRPTDSPGLVLMTLGGGATTLFDLTRSATFGESLKALRGKFDYVICDGSAIFSSSDASLMAESFDGAVLVVECERSRWEAVQDAKERLAKAGGKILGVALNKRRYYIPYALYGGR